MGDSFLGLSLTYWAIPCLVMAGVWTFLWPNYRAQGAPPVQRFLLRWAHALTWLLLAIALFVSGAGLPGGGLLGSILGLLALVSYVLFLRALLQPVRK
jgi:hypothetical protein